MQYADGILRPPVQKLVASIRFAPQRGKSAIEFCCLPQMQHHLSVVIFFGGARTRTHLNAICLWHIAATSSKTGGNYTICPPKGQIGHRVLLSPLKPSTPTHENQWFSWVFYFPALSDNLLEFPCQSSVQTPGVPLKESFSDETVCRKGLSRSRSQPSIGRTVS